MRSGAGAWRGGGDTRRPAARRLLGCDAATPFRHLYSGRTMREWVQLEGRTRLILALEEPLLKTASSYVRDQAGPR